MSSPISWAVEEHIHDAIDKDPSKSGNHRSDNGIPTFMMAVTEMHACYAHDESHEDFFASHYVPYC